MSYGEIGRAPIDVVINVRMISFWNKLLTYNQKLSSILYRIMYMLYMLSQRENVNFKCINHRCFVTVFSLSNVHLNEKFNPECTSENKGLKSST
jgi:hypothetical protein